MPIQLRIALATAGLLVAAVLGTALLLTETTRQALTAQMEVDTTGFVKQFARTLATDWGSAEQQARLDHLATDVLGEHLHAAWVIDPSGAVVAQGALPGRAVPRNISPTDTAHLRAAIQQKQTASYMEGPFFRVVAPVTTNAGPAAGPVYGAVLGYASTARLQDVLNRETQLAALSAAVLLVLFLAGFVLLARSFFRLLAQITTAVAAIEHETFRPEMLAAVAGRSDDLGHLARVLQRTASAVQERTERLQQQVQDLRVEVDAARKARDVAEITETDYFRELQQKAQAMRAKRSAPTGDAPAAR